jgi:hypothetical protein
MMSFVRSYVPVQRKCQDKFLKECDERFSTVQYGTVLVQYGTVLVRASRNGNEVIRTFVRTCTYNENVKTSSRTRESALSHKDESRTFID